MYANGPLLKGPQPEIETDTDTDEAVKGNPTTPVILRAEALKLTWRENVQPGQQNQGN
jgi:hypothetical protein